MQPDGSCINHSDEDVALVKLLTTLPQVVEEICEREAPRPGPLALCPTPCHLLGLQAA